MINELKFFFVKLFKVKETKKKRNQKELRRIMLCLIAQQ